MQVIRALFDGHDIKPVEPITTRKITEVLVIFPNDTEKIAPGEARRLLRGSGKGQRLTEKLLQARYKDMTLGRR